MATKWTIMQKRVTINEVEPNAYKAMLGLETYIHRTGIDHKLLHLIKIRASQVNGCAFCINMHTADARKEGETEQRIYALNAWRETPYFTDEERAVLAFTEAVTLIVNHVPDDVYTEMTRYFSEQQIAQIIMAIAAINAWNRMGIAANLMPA
jgi:AhpD family alkylhydroperoxidase